MPNARRTRGSGGRCHDCLQADESTEGGLPADRARRQAREVRLRSVIAVTLTRRPRYLVVVLRRSRLRVRSAAARTLPLPRNDPSACRAWVAPPAADRCLSSG